ncbi:uncharacterized protein LOC144666391 [Oculina patagonica]
MDISKTILLSLAILFAILSSPIEGLVCNGMAEFCDLRINQATFAGTHNSGAGFGGILYYHTKIGLSIPAWSCWYRSQGQSITKQLDNGIRYFDIDTCFVDSGRWERGPWTCHSGAYGGSIRKMLQQINEWMLRNPTEVVIIKFGRDTVHSKAEKIGSEILEQMKNLWEPTKEKTALKHLTLNDHRRRSWKWPTLGEAISSNQRIFLFMDNRLLGNSYYRYRWVYYANYEISLSWKPMNLIESSGCSKMVGAIQKRCAESYFYDFMEVDLFLTWGLCVKHLADWCNQYIDEASKKCFNERLSRQKATVNFIVVDWAGRTHGANKISEVAKRRNEQNVKFFLKRDISRS